MGKYISLIIFFGIFILQYSHAGYSGKNRIIERESVRNGGRCIQNITTDQCEVRRKGALDLGYISEEEYNALLNYSSYPLIDVFATPESSEGLAGWCQCGCFHPETLISMNENFSLPIKDINKGMDVLHLDKFARLDNFEFWSSPIRLITKGKENPALMT